MCSPVQMSPVAVFRYLHLMHGHGHSIGGLAEGHGECDNAVGTLNVVAMMTVTQWQGTLVTIDIDCACVQQGGIVAHTACCGAPHNDGLVTWQVEWHCYLSGLASMKMRFQRMLPGNDLSASNEMITNMGVPIM